MRGLEFDPQYRLRFVSCVLRQHQRQYVRNMLGFAGAITTVIRNGQVLEHGNLPKGKTSVGQRHSYPSNWCTHVNCVLFASFSAILRRLDADDIGNNPATGKVRPSSTASTTHRPKGGHSVAAYGRIGWVVVPISNVVGVCLGSSLVPHS